RKEFFLFNRINIWKKEITELKSKFDLITMHHVFEHIPDQIEVLKSIQSVLKNKGNLIIRIPVVNEAWKIYRENWVQLDAPRHYYIHSIDSFKLLAKKSGFLVTDIVFDSYALQFWGSEQYQMDIPLRNDNRSYAENIKTTIFTPQQITEWESKSVEFNGNKKGDQAIFYLKKIA
ncbi:MAG: class I SAM-dependent methyltransferase, partial [Ginsengibacter sp.]